MTKFNTNIPPVPQQRDYTHEGGLGYVRSARQELFIQAISEMAEDSFYETASERQVRLAANVQRVVNEPGGWQWIADFAKWLRNTAQMRSASVMVACEAVAAKGSTELPGPSARSLVDSVIVRADEPAEVLGYWLTQKGRQIPAPVKRGVADATKRLFTERNVLRYDGGSKDIRMADVIELTHPSPSTSDQSSLFKHIIDRRHNRPGDVPEQHTALAAREKLQTLDPQDRHSYMRRVQSGDQSAKQEFELAMAGQWEWAKSWLGTK